MPHQVIDLASHINREVHRGGPADFAVGLRPVSYPDGEEFQPIPGRLAVIREDTSEPLAVVSDRYRLVTHSRILEMVQQATSMLDIGPVPRGIFVDRHGARMRALFKFPSLARPVQGNDAICPCLKVQNTYDGTSRIAIHIGAFRFVCTNLAVGGGGVFAGGFMSVHAGEIPIEEVGKQLTSYLESFDAIVGLYRYWAETRLSAEAVPILLESLPSKAAKTIRDGLGRVSTVYAAYNVATDYATHQMRSVRGAFDLLEQINISFQEGYPVPKP